MPEVFNNLLSYINSLPPIVVIIISSILSIATSILTMLIEDRCGGFLLKNRNLELIKAANAPQVWIETLKTSSDIASQKARFESCSKIFIGELNKRGEIKQTIMLLLQNISFPKVSVSNGNINLIHIENVSKYGIEIKDLLDLSNEPVYCESPDLKYIAPNTSIMLVFNSYAALSGITIDYNGNRSTYTFANKSGSISPSRTISV